MSVTVKFVVVIFSLFLFTACGKGFCSTTACGGPEEEVTVVNVGADASYSDISSEVDVDTERFCDWTNPTELNPDFVHLDIRWTGDETLERDFYTDNILSVKEFAFSPYIVPQTYLIGVWCTNWIRVGGDDYWTDYREIPFLGQEFATFSINIPKEIFETYDYCQTFVNVFCASRGGDGCWHAVEMISGNEKYPIVQVNGHIEYCVDNSKVIDADIDDKHFYMQDREAYAHGFYLNEI
ncbi:MAG: hypothetical protein L3J07_04315 [Candidatus Magasanikbacteria bacterium]|nr:hypothetical protein [Candidatus Magasanikbacteria bacterium]